MKLTDRTVAPGKGPAWVRFIVDYGGPLAFLLGFFATGRDMVAATWWLVGGSAFALAVGWLVERRIAPLPLFAGLMALVFGTLTLVFNDQRFVMMKPTFINLALAAGLLGGLVLKRNALRLLLGDTLKLPEGAWRQLTLRYGLFFLAVAAANEVVWRTYPDQWIWWRFPGLQLLAIVFSLTQVPLMMRHMHRDEPPPPPVE